MNKAIMMGILAAVVLMVVLFAVNIVLTAKRGTSSVAVAKGVYLAGIAAAILNVLRMIFIYKGDRGTLLIANFVVLVCLIIGFLRQGKEQG